MRKYTIIFRLEKKNYPDGPYLNKIYLVKIEKRTNRSLTGFKIGESFPG